MYNIIILQLSINELHQWNKNDKDIWKIDLRNYTISNIITNELLLKLISMNRKSSVSTTEITNESEKFIYRLYNTIN